MRGWLYGVNPVREALRAGREIKSLYVFSPKRKSMEDVIKLAEAKGVKPSFMHDAAFFDTRFPKGHQGIAIEVQRDAGSDSRGGRIELEALLDIPSRRNEQPFFVVVDCIEDPRNLGAVLRSVDATGVHGVVTQERRTASVGPEAVKSSAGAAEHVALCVVSNIKHAMDDMKERGILVVGAEAGGAQTPWEADLKGPVAIVIGSEGKGLRRTVREQCDLIVSLPMRGQVNSLNTSVAAGILLYEVIRQRGGK